MMTRRVIPLGLALLSLVVCADAQRAMVLAGGTLITPGSAPNRQRATIVVEGDRITQVGPPERVKAPAGAEVVDVRGKFIIPGLFDVHNHLGTGTFGPAERSPTQNLAALLTWGVTTVFSTGTSRDSFAALKRASKANESPSARFFSSGVTFGARGGWGGEMMGGYTPSTPEEARANVRDAAARGVDAIKVVYDDMSWLTKQPMPMFEPPVMRAILDEAHVRGLKAYVHAPLLRFAKDALRAGADVLVHGIVSDPVDAELIDLMRKNGAYYTATQAAFEACADLGAWSRTLQAFDDRGRLPAEVYEGLRTREARARWEQMWSNTAYTKAQLPVLRSNLKQVADAGIPIVIGTDTGVPGVLLGLSSQIELLLHVQAGLSPMATLTAATLTAARMIGHEADLGAVAPGRQADLVMLETDPLDDIRNVRHIARVMKGGRW